MESVQSKLSRVRKPRVHIIYDVETEGGVEKKELPFVLGVLGDFSGDTTEGIKPLKDRSFVQIDQDNFNDVMANVSPSLNIKVNNVIKGDESQLDIGLKFKQIEDFEPIRVINQIEPLKQLLETRNKLRDLMSKADRSTDLEEILEQLLTSAEDLQKVATDLGITTKQS